MAETGSDKCQCSHPSFRGRRLTSHQRLKLLCRQRREHELLGLQSLVLFEPQGFAVWGLPVLGRGSEGSKSKPQESPVGPPILPAAPSGLVQADDVRLQLGQVLPKLAVDLASHGIPFRDTSDFGKLIQCLVRMALWAVARFYWSCSSYVCHPRFQGSNEKTLADSTLMHLKN